MTFICLKYIDPKKWAQLSRDEQADCREQALSFDQSLQTAGHLSLPQAAEISGSPLLLRFRNGQIDAEDPKSDGEELWGLLFLEARDMNHAISLLSHHPDLRRGAFRIHAARSGDLR